MKVVCGLSNWEVHHQTLGVPVLPPPECIGQGRATRPCSQHWPGFQYQPCHFLATWPWTVCQISSASASSSVKWVHNAGMVAQHPGPPQPVADLWGP